VNRRQLSPVRTLTTPATSIMPTRSGPLQRAAIHPSSFSPHPSEVPPIAHEVSRSLGQPQDASKRAFMEPRMGHDFSQVPPHSGAVAEVSARVVNANATPVRESMRLSHFAQRPQFDFARIPVTTTPIQRKPTLNSPGDPFEREADDLADRVMRMVEPIPIVSAPASIQRKCAGCEEEEKEGPAQHAPAGALQSIEGREQEEEERLKLPEVAVQRKAEFGAAVAVRSPFVVDRLVETQSGGELLACGMRQQMEAAFGRDFSRVRVHRDGEAAKLSHQLSALAFTHGSHIYFGSGKYDPEGSSGKRLLAHELTHVVQQGQAATRRRGDAAPTVTAVQTTPPKIQRAANWAVPVPHETNNLVDTSLTGADAGATNLMINGVIGGGALNAPTVTVSAVPPPPFAAGGFDARVTAVPVNTCSVDQTVLASGPWRRVEPRANIGARFPALASCAGAGNCNFRARGNPSDKAMHDANRRHEDRHRNDGQAAFNGSVVPWDANLTAANAAGTTFHGATEAAARAAVFAAMGGTVAQVRAALVAAWNAAINVYHGTPAGGGIGPPTDPTAATDCSWGFVRHTNPS
jgi:hypothetical protein